MIGSTTDTEEARIRAVYARRGKDPRYFWFNPGHLLFMQDRERHVLALFARHGVSSLEEKKILEIGCGTGYWLRELVKWGARPEHLVGLDLVPERVAEARTLCHRATSIQVGNAAHLALDTETFDIVIQSTVFTSILDPEVKRHVASEMMRVVKRDGLIVWYDYHVNNPWNPDVRGVKKREIFELFRGCQIELRRITLMPPLLRLLTPYSWLAASALSSVPLFCTHYLGAIRKG